jgi:hypothetical protein
MQPLSEPRRKALEIAQNYFRRANLHPSYLEWRSEAIENFGFYDGSGQWSETEIARVRALNQVPLTVNVIQGRVDSLSGVEIQSRYRNAVQNGSENPENDKLALGLTNWLYFVQKDQKMPYKGSLKFRDEIVCGIGWSGQYQENGCFFYDYVHPYNIIPDFDDLSPQFDSMKFVCRKRWVEPDVVRKTWPKVSGYIDFSDPTLCTTVYSPELMDRSSNYTNSTNYTGYSQSRVLVIEVQHKVPRKAFYGLDTQGFYFETFDEEKAEEMANSSRDIAEKDSTQIIRTLFLDNFLLETAPLNPNIPGLKDFSYIPCVWKRRTKTGVPYGLVDCMKSIQIDSNTRITKALYLINSSKVFIKGKLPAGMTVKEINRQIKDPASAVMLPPDCEIEIKHNDPLSNSQIAMVDKYDGLMQRVTGLYDDLLGKQTNAESGVAQKQRQISSVRNNVFAFDNFADMKEREARFMLALFQGGDVENMLSQIVTEDQKETIILNLVRTIKGKKIVFNDVRTLPVSLEIEEVPDYKNSMEENRIALENLFSNPNAPIIIQSPTLMKIFGIRDYEKVSQEVRAAMMAQQQGQAQPISRGNPTAQSPEQNMAYPGL